MHIRQGTREDAASLTSLLEQLGHPLTETEVETKIGLFTDAGYRLLVCEVENKTVGFLSLHWFDKFHSVEKTGRITALCVDASVRDMGIGAALVHAGEQLLKDHGCREVEVTTNLRRSLTPEFYRKNGYEEHSRHFIKSLI